VIAAWVGMHRRGIEGIRERFVEEGFEATLVGKERGHRQRFIQGEDGARFIALVCGTGTGRVRTLGHEADTGQVGNP
jgi:hypothetical protein